MDHTVVAAVQLSSQADVGKNLDRAAALIGEAARAGAKIVLLPENFAYLGGDEAGKRGVAEPLEPAANGPIAQRLAEVARARCRRARSGRAC
jgi:deaminated glutathione amidase